MRGMILLGSALLLLAGCSTAATTHKAVEAKVYNETFNPRQKEYPNHVGFNDLHIQAIRHDLDIFPYFVISVYV